MFTSFLLPCLYLQIVSKYDEDSSNYVHEDDVIINACSCLNILYFSSLLGGEVDRKKDDAGIAASSEALKQLEQAGNRYGGVELLFMDEMGKKPKYLFKTMYETGEGSRIKIPHTYAGKAVLETAKTHSKSSNYILTK